MSKDSFADLWTSKNKDATANMSLADRQKQEQKNKAEQAKQWSGLDFLGSSTSSMSGPLSGNSTGSTTLSNTNTGSGTRATELLAASGSSNGLGTGSGRAMGGLGKLAADNTGSSNPFMPTFKPIDDERFKQKVPVAKDPFDLMDMGMSAPLGSGSAPASHTDSPVADSHAEDDPFAVFNQPVKKPEPQQPQRREIVDPDPPRIQKTKTPAKGAPRRGPPGSARASQGNDKAVAELVDMGFSADQASAALDMTPTGKDVAMAIDIIMKQAHAAAKGETYVPPETKQTRSRPTRQSQPQFDRQPDEWERQSHMDNGDSRDGSGRDTWESRADKDMITDATKVASQLGAQFMSKAGSLWSVGRKNLAKAVETYQQGGGQRSDGSPAWMKDAKNFESGHEDSYQPMGESFKDSDDSEEEEEEAPRRQEPSRRQEPPRQHRQQEAPRHAPPAQSRKFKFDDDEEVIAPRRRREREVTPEVKQTRAEPVGDIWDAPKSVPAKSAPKAASKAPARTQAAPEATLFDMSASAGPSRPHVSISSMAMDMVTDGRNKGTEAVKQGSYDLALEHYNQALANVPSPHVLRALLLSNRAFCHLKAGDAKAAITDSDEGLTIIGPGLGQGEEVEPGKSLKDIWSKLVMRKAEGLEHQERHQLAIEQWTLLVSNGFTTKQVMDGKRRCVAHVAPKPAAKAQPAATKASRPAATSASTAPKAPFKPAPPGKYENLDRVRASHEKAAKEEAEKAVLTDTVAAQIDRWRGGNEENLRALLATLDTVLWPEVGWKKITVADLVVNKKVKINYMKAVAKTHPDKITPDTPTERKMIANGVFITLNKAWDVFKTQNNMT